MSKWLLHGAACKHKQCGPAVLSFLLVGKNTNNTEAKDTPEKHINKAVLFASEWVFECVELLHSEKQRDPL